MKKEKWQSKDEQKVEVSIGPLIQQLYKKDKQTKYTCSLPVNCQQTAVNCQQTAVNRQQDAVNCQ